MAKATDAEIELRIATLYEMIVKGCSRAYIVRYSSEKWNIGERQVDDYLKLVKDKIQDTYGKEYKETILNNHLAQLENLYAKNYIIEDFRECRTIIESRNKLLGLNAVEKLEIKMEKPIFKQIDLDVTSDDGTD
jgi:hypothetical protein